MLMYYDFSNTDVLIILGLILIFIIGTIGVIIEGLMILALPFVLIKSLFSKDENDSGSNFSEIPTNLVSDNASKEVNESINNSKLDDFENISKSKDAIGIVIGI